MLHIAICDDEKDFVQYLTDLLNQYSKETGRDIKITPYYDGMPLWKPSYKICWTISKANTPAMTNTG